MIYERSEHIQKNIWFIEENKYKKRVYKLKKQMWFNRKYRPKNFELIEWQDQVKDILKSEVEQWKLSSSYIFFWPRWTWKTSIARILTRAINCTSKDTKPCNECESCKLINEWKTLDFVEIDAASNTQVDKIREEIIDKSVYPPTTLKKKVYIIDEVHMLSKSAFNALLKIMEEPAEYLTFILATTEINKVPETIISRCEVFNFKRISQDEIVQRLKFIAKQENLEYTEDWLKLISKISDGAMRDAIKYLEQVSVIWEVNADSVGKFLGIVPEREIVDFLETLDEWNIEKIYAKIDKLQGKWTDLGNFAKDILSYLDEHLLENIEKNIRLVKLFDEIYRAVKEFPSSSLAYKTSIWEFLIENWLIESDLKNKKEKQPKELKKDNQKEKEGKTQVEDNKQETREKKQEDKEAKKEKDWKSKEFTKEELIDKLPSAQTRWAIKNFADLERENWKLKIIIVSKLDFDMLSRSERQKELDETIQTISPWCDFELKFLEKEEYLKFKIQN